MRRIESFGPVGEPHRRPRMSPAVAVTLLLVCLLPAGCEKKTEQAAAPPIDVLVVDVAQRDVPIYTEAVGTTDGSINAQIRARVQGYLQTRDYKEGSLVKKGDLLFTIDPRQYQAALDEATGQLGRAQASLTKTDQDVARYSPLAKEGAISQQELDNAVQANRAARAQSESARAALEQAKLNLDWTRVTSPVDGIAGIAIAQIGDLIAPNTLLTTVSQLDPIKVTFPISEQLYMQLARRIEQVSKGETPERSNGLELILADGSVYPQKGRVELADRQVDPKTGTITLVSYFPNPGNILRPGQFAKVRAATETAKGALLVPQRAVLEQQGQYLVAVVKSDNTVDVHPVKVGTRVGTDWIVQEGLKPGERVAAEGLQKLRSGMKVNPKPYVAPTVAAAAPGA
ncbi:MAG: efflux RND transporter periplasmic adaptor subunit [Candidatus Binatia bacterium]